MSTQVAVPLDLAILTHAQGRIGTDLDAITTVIAKTHRIGVVAGLALEITAVKEDYEPVAGAVNAGKRQYFINNCLLQVHG